MQTMQQVQNFGEPFFLVIHEGETLAEVKVRIQKKLQVPDEEFSKVYLSFGSSSFLWCVIPTNFYIINILVVVTVEVCIFITGTPRVSSGYRYCI